MKLGTKIGLGFGALLAIALSLGLTGYTLAHRNDAAIREIGQNRLPSIHALDELQYCVGLIKTAQRTLLDPDCPEAVRTRNLVNVDKGRERYQIAWKTYESLPQSAEEAELWKQLVAALGEGKNDNDAFFRLEEERHKLGLGNPHTLEENLRRIERDHERLRALSLKLAFTGEAFEGGEDVTQCGLGQWVRADQRKNSQLQAILKDIQTPHQQFHDAVRQVKERVKAGDMAGAAAIQTNQVDAACDKVFEHLASISALSAQALALQEKMAQQALEKCNVSQLKVDQAMEKVVKLNEDEANTATAAAIQAARFGKVMAIAMTLAGLVLGIGVAVYIIRSITKPLRQGVEFAKRMAEGDLTQKLNIKRQDEIGHLARAMNEMGVNLRQMFRGVAGNAQSVAGASQELSAASTQVSSNAEETSAQSNTVASAAEQVSRNIATVATAAEELTVSVKEIAKQAIDASKVANQAVNMAESTNTTMAKLGESSGEIGNVIKVITSIAEQTNLLALNATIEAARAGEAGKGFAVVANEVKELAKQTAKATEDIAQKIGSIQADSAASVRAIQEISGIIRKIDEIQTVIASAVEEQAATTNEISRNANEAARGSEEITKNIVSVSEAAKSSTQAATNTSCAASELAQLAAQLTEAVRQFKIEDTEPTASLGQGEAGPQRRGMVPASLPSPGGNGKSHRHGLRTPAEALAG